MKSVVRYLKKIIVTTTLKACHIPVKISFKILKHTNWTEMYLSEFMREYERNYPYYISYIKRPKYAKQYVSIEEPDEFTKNTAIIMQGPLRKEDNYTVETVKFYHKIYPGATVIVTTWKDEDPRVISELRRQPDCIVVLNEYPQYSGVLNVNYQAWSTFNGIKKAKELGLEYAWKTRADHRYLRKGAIRFMCGLLEQYPVDESVGYQKKRIVTAAAFLFRPYWNADQWNFGQIDDLYHYWNHDLVKKNLTTPMVFGYLRRRHIKWVDRTRKHLEAETSILLDYLRRMEGKEPQMTVKEYWKRIKNQFVVVSRGELLQHWIKDEYGSKYDESLMSGIYFADDTEDKCNSYIWDYEMWLALYQGKLKYKVSYEKYKENKY